MVRVLWVLKVQTGLVEKDRERGGGGRGSETTPLLLIVVELRSLSLWSFNLLLFVKPR